MEKISVSIRVRPVDKQEAAKSLWKINSNSITLCNGSGVPLTSQVFIFDNVFGIESSTFDIYKATTQDIVASAIKGFNGTVFAYGQTSSGKTFTMRGTQDVPGIIPLAIHDVFENLEKAVDREFLLRMSYMEIYNEDINDLLAPEQTKLQVHESLERGIYVAGLREEIVTNPDHVLQLMEFGEAHRHVGETNMNLHSSRSHTIFRMVIESRDKTHDDSVGFSCDAVRVSVLNLVDLAGSERVAKTGAEGTRLKEGTHINKSLMVLGTVINKLSEGNQNQGGHVPYRDSKLTRILQPALGGNARTAIICNITPAAVHVDESRGTLQFASRAIRVTNCAQVNEILTDAALLKRQKKEIEELRSKLKESHSEHLEEEILFLRNTLLKTECERERIALELEEEKRAHAERERMQAQKIENLSTLVLNTTVEDREIEKRSKKNSRRGTWCPGSISRSMLDKDVNKSAEEDWWIEQNRDGTSSLPPPFESLLEEEESSNDRENDGRCTNRDKDGDSDYVSLRDCNARMHVAERKRKHLALRPFDDLQEELNLFKKAAHGSALQVTNDSQLSALVSNRGNKMELESSNVEGSQSPIAAELDLKYINDEVSDTTVRLKSNDSIIEQLRKELSEAKDEAGNYKHELTSALEELEQLKKEGQASMHNNVEELKALVERLTQENQELGVQLKRAYMHFEEEKAALVAAPRPLKEEYLELSMTSGQETAEQVKIKEGEHLREQARELESLIVTLNSEKQENTWELELLRSNVRELQEKAEAANALVDDARHERDKVTLEATAMQARMDELQTELQQEKSSREKVSEELCQLREELSSTGLLLNVCEADSTKERWILKTEILKLQVHIDALSAKLEVFHGRMLEAQDELKDAYEELDGLKRKQSRETFFTAGLSNSESPKRSMPDAAVEKFENGRRDIHDAMAICLHGSNTNEHLAACNPAQSKFLCLEKEKTQPIGKENMNCLARGSQPKLTEETKLPNARLPHTVCMPLTNTTIKQQEVLGQGQRRPRLSSLALNGPANQRVSAEIVSQPAVSKTCVALNPVTGGHAGIKAPKPMPAQRTTVRSKASSLSKEIR